MLFRSLRGKLPAVVVLGVFRAALESATEALSSKVSSFSGQTLRDQAPIQELIAHYHGAYRAARAGVVEATKAMWEVAATGEQVSLRMRADLYAASAYAIDTMRETISRLYARGTRAAFMQGNPVERALRNIHAIAFGVESARGHHQSAGRVLLGGEPLEPLF